MQMVGILVGNTFCYFDIVNWFVYIIDCLFGNNILNIIFYYIASYTFKFCNWHRFIITSNLVTVLIIQYDIIIGIPITDYHLLMSYYIVATIFSLLAIYSKFHCYVKSN